LAGVIVDNPDSAVETHCPRALGDDEGILKFGDPAAQHRVDVYAELGILGEPEQLLIQNLQALF
jgi:hypothetical protein